MDKLRSLTWLVTVEHGAARLGLCTDKSRRVLLCHLVCPFLILSSTEHESKGKTEIKTDRFYLDRIKRMYVFFRSFTYMVRSISILSPIEQLELNARV